MKQRTVAMSAATMVRLAGCVVLLAALSACASTAVTQRMYSGELLPVSEIAVLKGNDPMRLISLDKKGTTYNGDGFKRFGNWSVEVLPGEHWVEVTWYSEDSPDNPEYVMFNAEAGKMYKAEFMRDGLQVHEVGEIPASYAQKRQ